MTVYSMAIPDIGYGFSLTYYHLSLMYFSSIQPRPSGNLIRLFSLGLIMLFLFLNKVQGQIPADTLYLNNQSTYPLNKFLYIVDKSAQVTVETIATKEAASHFQKMYPKKVLDIGVAEKYYWLVFTLKNNSENDAIHYLQLHYPGANYVYAWAKSKDEFKLIGRTGIRLPFNARPYNHYDAVIPLSLRAGASATYLIMIDKLGESLNIRPTLTNSNAFQTEENFLYSFYGLIAGIMLTSIIVNIFLYISLKQKIHLQYAAYVFIILAWIFDGINYQLFFSNYPVIPAISEFVTTSAGLVMMSYLIVSFLELKPDNCFFLKPIIIIRYILILMIPLSYFAIIGYGDMLWPKVIYLYVTLAVACTAVVLFVAAAIQSAWQKNKLAWFYLASVSYLAFAIIEYIFYVLGYNQNSRMYQLPSDIQIGVLIETIIIFLGIIYRYNLYKRDKMMLLAQINHHQQETATQIIEAQEEERKRLAQDLHDDVGATLSTLLLHISNLPEENHWNYSEAMLHHQKSIVISKKALADLRLISHNLLPKDFSSLGIFRILQNKIDELNSLGITDFRLVTSGNDSDINLILSITLYRIINELINNVIKHAMASYCNVELIIDLENLVLIIEDNGTGISTTGKHFGIGLKNIKSRVEFLNGILNIDGNRNGTSIIIEIPLKQQYGA